jgi:hypothetical protein
MSEVESLETQKRKIKPKTLRNPGPDAVNFLFVREGEDGEWNGEMRGQSRGTGDRCSGVQRGDSHQRSNRVKGRAGSCQREIKFDFWGGASSNELRGYRVQIRS